MDRAERENPVRFWWIMFLMLLGCLAALIGSGFVSEWTAQPACAPHADAAYQEAVLCCCNTSNGLCCADVAFCGGYIPGCFCQ